MANRSPVLEDGTILDVPEYRRTLGAFMTGVTVVTTIDGDGRPRGMTMNSFTSVSLDPPLVLVCVDKGAASYDAFVDSECMAIHILGSEQQDLARTFASKSPDKFSSVDVELGRSGAHIIRDVHAWLDCKTAQVVDAGDHAIIIGHVLDFDAQDRRPLAFYQGKFNTFSADEEIVRQQSATRDHTLVRWVIETLDENLAVMETEGGTLRLPETKLKASQLSHEGLSAAASAQLGSDVKVDFLYSVYDGEEGQTILVYRGRIENDDRALAPVFSLVQPSDSTASKFSDGSEQAVVRRYASERTGPAFGIYSGSWQAGSVASLSSVDNN